MKIIRDFILEKLKNKGYIFYENKYYYVFFKNAQINGVFQKLHIEFQGKNRRAVYGTVSTSITRYIRLKIDKIVHIHEIDQDHERNWTIIKSNDEASNWCDKFVALAPSLAEECALIHSSHLLEITQEPREFATFQLKKLNLKQPYSEQITNFGNIYGSSFIKKAEELAFYPGVLQVKKFEEPYMLACCAVLSDNQYKNQNENNPLGDNQLMWKIQIIADSLISNKIN